MHAMIQAKQAQQHQSQPYLPQYHARSPNMFHEHFNPSAMVDDFYYRIQQ